MDEFDLLDELGLGKPQNTAEILPVERTEALSESFKNAYEVMLFEELHTAFMHARKGKRRSADEHNFEMRLFENLIRLHKAIISRQYQPTSGIAFIVFDPKIREIFAAPFRDRVVHHYIYDNVMEWWDKRLIYDSYSCRKGKGALLGVRRLYHFMQRESDNFTKKAHIIKLDLKSYFMSMSRKKLYARAMWGLDRQFADGGYKYDVLKFLWRQVIFDDPTLTVRRRGTKADWAKLPYDKSLFNQPPGQGIVIGNLSSQLLSNILLDELDRYVIYDLKYRAYGRYVDDFYIVVPEDRFSQAKKDVLAIEHKLFHMGLKLHPKKRHIQPVSHGIEFVGYVVRPHRILPSRRILKNFRRAVYDMASGEGSLESLQSYLGHLRYMKSDRLVRETFSDVGWEYRY